MTNREITAVAIKVFAIFVLVQAILTLPSFIYPLSMSLELSHKGAIWLWFWAALSLAAIVWVLYMLWHLSCSVTRDIENKETDQNVLEIDEGFILSVLGLVFVFEGALSFASGLISATSAANSSANPQPISATTVAHIAGQFAKVIIGLTMILKANGWAAVLRAIREAGLKNKISGSID